MRIFFLLAALTGLSLIALGCAESTTPGQPAAEGDTPAATQQHEVMKPVIEEPAAEAEASPTESTEPVAETVPEAEPKTEANEQPAERTQPEPEATEPANETPASQPE